MNKLVLQNLLVQTVHFIQPEPRGKGTWSLCSLCSTLQLLSLLLFSFGGRGGGDGNDGGPLSYPTHLPSSFSSISKEKKIAITVMATVALFLVLFPAYPFWSQNWAKQGRQEKWKFRWELDEMAERHKMPSVSICHLRQPATFCLMAEPALHSTCSE